ncbi:MAG: hypothetical protein HRT89_23060, partial [Lentisphaeria bacterium]|nr:hypothetical protein [Lentisphaeria bacterium]NQZ70941.1 hypothetical protein [Lentisphaeria bacterium]
MAVDRVLQGLAAKDSRADNRPTRPATTYGKPQVHESRETVKRVAPMSYMGSNEYVLDVKFDAAGNIYVITWGHGDNLYSLDPKGKLRFSKRLPEMGASRIDMDVDRVVVYTACGSRLYQVGLDGKPIAQARLTMDPGPMNNGINYRIRPLPDLRRHDMHTSPGNFLYAYVPGKRKIVYLEPLTQTMRVLDETYTILAEWKGETFKDKDGDTLHRHPASFACNPAGTMVAQIEQIRGKAQHEKINVIASYLVIRDIATGHKVNERPVSKGGVSWTEKGLTVGGIRLDENLKALGAEPKVANARFRLGAVGALVPDGSDLRLVRPAPKGNVEVSRLGPFVNMPTFAFASPDEKYVVLLDQDSAAFIHEVASGKRVVKVQLSEMSYAWRFLPDSSAFVLGGLRGSVMCIDVSGKILWQTALMQHNKTLSQEKLDLPNFDPTFPDYTEKLWQDHYDKPGELDKLVNLDADRLTNGNCEQSGGWQVDSSDGAKAALTYASDGYKSKRCLKVGKLAVQQEVKGLIGDHFTWVLEFFYRSAAPDKTSGLLAGVSVQNRHPDSVVRVFSPGKDWRFGRIAFKSGGDPTSLTVGFQAKEGEVLIDHVSFRRIRFPSINHMFHPPGYNVEPVILRNPLFEDNYSPLPGILREQIPNRIVVQRSVKTGGTLVCESFLQNGRLNEISSDWYIQPMVTRDSILSLGLKSPRWVSTVALYFNAYDEANTTPHFDIMIVDAEQKKKVIVASVRNNKSLFRIVRFPPRLADEVRVLLVNAVPRLRTLTEVEIYGPMSGGESAGFTDPAGQNTYMGTFSRVDKRPMALAPKYERKAISDARKAAQGGPLLPNWALPASQVLMDSQGLYLSRTLGYNQRFKLDPSTLSRP